MLKDNSNRQLEASNISKKVATLIRNKIEPLSYKFYVLKSGKMDAFQSKTCKSQIQDSSKQKETLRRNAMMRMKEQYGEPYFKNLQRKVEHHIMIRRINLLEDKFTVAEESSEREKSKICNKLMFSSLQKYVEMFEKSERPSEKVRRIENHSCERILQEIKTTKTVKNIECVEQNTKELANLKQPASRPRESEEKNFLEKEKTRKRNNRKLKRQILRDIKKQYDNQGSSKIRITTNHRKMIHIK